MLPAKLKLNKRFQPCPLQPGEEMYPNGIFVFNITQLLAFMDANPDRFALEHVAVTDIRNYGPPANEKTIRCADLSRPIVLAEISPARFNLIDGHHRIERARREGVPSVPARRIRCPEHLRFLTSIDAYESYVVYWNSKLRELQRATASRPDRKRWVPRNT